MKNHMFIKTQIIYCGYISAYLYRGIRHKTGMVGREQII